MQWPWKAIQLVLLWLGLPGAGLVCVCMPLLLWLIKKKQQKKQIEWDKETNVTSSRHTGQMKTLTWKSCTKIGKYIWSRVKLWMQYHIVWEAFKRICTKRYWRDGSLVWFPASLSGSSSPGLLHFSICEHLYTYLPYSLPHILKVF